MWQSLWLCCRWRDLPRLPFLHRPQSLQTISLQILLLLLILLQPKQQYLNRLVSIFSSKMKQYGAMVWTERWRVCFIFILKRERKIISYVLLCINKRQYSYENTWIILCAKRNYNNNGVVRSTYCSVQVVVCLEIKKLCFNYTSSIIMFEHNSIRETYMFSQVFIVKTKQLCILYPLSCAYIYCLGRVRIFLRAK